MEKEQKERIFMKGLYCGVILTFLCLLLVVGFSGWRMRRKVSEKKETNIAQEKLELDGREIGHKIEEIEKTVNEMFMGEIDSQQVEDTIYRGMLWGLEDVYTEYYSEEDMKAMEDSISGSYSGIGATLIQDVETNQITVESCFEGSPAAEAGVLPGDIVYGMNGQELKDRNLTEVVSEIKSEENDVITLMIRRGEETIELEVVPRAIEVPTVNGQMLEESIGYLQITEFDDVTTNQFEETLAELQAEGMQKLIVDVRNNPGGNLEVVCEILDQILPEGMIVYTEDKNGERKEYFSDAKRSLQLPMAVLINENSASAAEIFAGAIKDYGLGTLVGTTTFGKGIVQRLFHFTDGTGMKLTIAKYYTPNGNDIHEKGVEPDVEIEQIDDGTGNTTEAEDVQLQKAIHILGEN
ncbi:MAG: S41 family peptidase [Marvinbryantia sp.]|jgi:carboxyl-terminal processing protease